MKQRPMWNTLGWILVCELVGFASSFFVRSSVDSWLPTLNAPAFNPPSWVFGPVWIALYALMGISISIALRKAVSKKERKQFFSLFVFQLFLNAAWSGIFFGAHFLGWAFIDLAILLLTVFALLILFAHRSRTAAYLLLPYIFWLIFAGYLNLSFWMLNPLTAK